MGQMGEAGDEGILPLANVNGRLGVRAAGARVMPPASPASAGSPAAARQSAARGPAR